MYKKPKSGKKTNLSQFGLLDVDIDDNDDELMDMSDDDIDLEAELAAISGGDKPKRPRKPAPMPAANLDAMIAQSLKDVPSDEEGSDVDEDDPDLLDELNALSFDEDEAPPPPPRASRPAPPPPGAPVSAESSTISLLQDRISNYALAEKNAKQSGESSRARRFARGLKTLNDLLKQAKAGKPISDDDIPPPVTIGKPVPPTAPATVADPEPPPTVTDLSLTVTDPAPTVTDPAPTVTDPDPTVTEPAPSAPELEDEPASLPEPVEPPPPPPVESEPELDPEKQRGLHFILQRKEEFKAAALSSKRAGDKATALEFLKVVKQFDLVVQAYKAGQEMDLTELPTPQAVETALRSQPKVEAEVQHSEEPAAPPAAENEGLITATTLDEALRQRLAAFQQQAAKAKEEGNSSKARRMGRIVKQYEDAVKRHAAGKPLDTADLPAPAGHGPLPGDSHLAPARPSPSSPPATPLSRAAPSPPASSSRHAKQLALLLHRQKQFKEAAIKAKKAGDIEQAKQYLRAAKGFDAVIEAARGGLLVDMQSLPLPPRAKAQLDNTFDVVAAEDCTPADLPCTISTDGDDSDVLARLHQQLSTQLALCRANRDHNQAMGNIAEANRFEHLAVTVQQDLDVVAVAKRLGQDPPKFHYESRQFSVVQCNTDLNENDLELTIVRGIAYNVPNPKEIDTYVKFEFPFPQDAPVSDRTALVKDTNSPSYNAVFPLAIQRGARPCLRVFKRHALKLEVYSRGGWFRSDALLGACAVKLAPLEQNVTLHEAFPLMDGRRPAGGSLEVKLRVRTPLLQPQVAHTTHRWLVVNG